MKSIEMFALLCDNLLTFLEIQKFFTLVSIFICFQHEGVDYAPNDSEGSFDNLEGKCGRFALKRNNSSKSSNSKREQPPTCGLYQCLRICCLHVYQITSLHSWEIKEQAHNKEEDSPKYAEQ